MAVDDGRDTATLVNAARGGDRAAYAVLAVRHLPVATALCRRLVGPVLAEDAAQEAALAGWAELDRLRDAERFGPWLAGIALNVCRGWLRRRARGAPEDPLPQGLADPAPGPDDVAEATELADRVRRALACLPAGQRAAVAGFYLQGLTHRELAAELGTTVGAVKTRLHRGRTALRDHLLDYTEERPVTPSTPVPMRVTDVHRLPGEEGLLEPHVVVLDEVGGDRRLPIWIGPPEAVALALTLQTVAMPRPLTFRFAADLVGAAGARMTECRIVRLTGSTFFAEVHLEGPAGPAAVDARPSDALNLALVTGARITAETAVLEAAEGHETPLPGVAEGDTARAGAAAVVADWLARRPIPDPPAA